MDIDAVVLWVDGNDPEWLAEKKQYSPASVDDSNSDNRFRDNGLMKYWFRSVEHFIPWIRTVYFVTWGHLPEFLNVQNPKLRIIKHSDYMPIDSLPTFNSCSLEMNLHRIEGLSEQFIYFNDDMYILHPLKMDQFFSADGLPCHQFSEVPTMFKGNLESWQVIAANSVGIVNKYFDKRDSQKGNLGKYVNCKYKFHDNVRSLILKLLFPEIFTGFKNFHSPAAFLKSTYMEIWEKEQALLKETTHHRFRDLRDVSQWLILWWQMGSGNFSPCRMNTATLSADDNSVDHICDIIKNQRYDMISVNDPPTVVNFELVAKKLQNAFDMILPDKSSFEV